MKRFFLLPVVALLLSASAALAAPANPPGNPAWQATPPATSPYPAGSTPAANAGTGTTGAVTAALPAVVGQYNFLCGFEVSAIGGTAAVGPITVGVLVGTTTFNYELASTATGTTLQRVYSPCIPTGAANTAITVTTTADGTASNVGANIWGYSSPFPQ